MSDLQRIEQEMRGNGWGAMNFEGTIKEWADQIAAYRKQMGEPVAWLADDGRTCTTKTKDIAMHRRTAESFCTPLYAAPPMPSVTRETLRKTLKDERNYRAGMDNYIEAVLRALNITITEGS